MLAMAEDVYSPIPGKLAQLLRGPRQNSLVFPDHNLRCLTHQLGPTVVAQAAPRGKHIRFLCCRKRGNGREHGQKTGIVIRTAVARVCCSMISETQMR